MNEKLKKVKCFLLDMDGTVYLGSNVIDGAIDAVKRMNEYSRAMFLTNNSSLGRPDYAKKLSKMGFDVTEEDIFTSGNATVEYLNTYYKGKKIFLFGTEELRREFIDGGIILEDEQPDLIVLGFDITFTYQRLEHMCDLIREGVPFIATHPDINCPTTRGFKPDLGALMKLIETSTGATPLLICGKPNRPIGESISRLLGLKPEEIAMVATD